MTWQATTDEWRHIAFHVRRNGNPALADLIMWDVERVPDGAMMPWTTSDPEVARAIDCARDDVRGVPPLEHQQTDEQRAQAFVRAVRRGAPPSVVAIATMVAWLLATHPLFADTDWDA